MVLPTLRYSSAAAAGEVGGRQPQGQANSPMSLESTVNAIAMARPQTGQGPNSDRSPVIGDTGATWPVGDSGAYVQSLERRSASEANRVRALVENFEGSIGHEHVGYTDDSYDSRKRKVQFGNRTDLVSIWCGSTSI